MGNLLWGSGGVAIYQDTVGIGGRNLISDDGTGAIITWSDNRNGNFDIYAQHVNPLNAFPTLDSVGNQEVDVGEELTIQLLAYDPDTGDTLRYATNASSVLPTAFEFDENTGLFKWTPSSGDAGDYYVRFSVTDGEYSDNETIMVSAFEYGDRPPLLSSINDIIENEGDAVVITASATDPDGDTLYFSIDDPRFVQEDSIFTWQTTPGDSGSYYIELFATDGILSDSCTTEVSVLLQKFTGIEHDCMFGDSTYFLWQGNDASWHTGNSGFLSGPSQGSWSSGAVSESNYNSAHKPFAIFRFYRGATNYMLGFTSTPPWVTDFYIDKIDLGIHVSANGTIRPTWDYNNPFPESPTLPVGYYDLKISLDQTSGMVSFAIEEAADYFAAFSDFSSPVWVHSEPRTIEDTYYVQINNYDEASRIYDTWCSHSNRAPVLESIDDITIYDQNTVIIVANAVDFDGDSISYFIDDPNFEQDDNVFTWLTTPADVGTYHPVVSVTDGYFHGSLTVNVTVLPQPVTGFIHDPMTDNTTNYYNWSENRVIWHQEEDGYLSADRDYQLSAGIVSARKYDSSDMPSAIFRFHARISCYFLGFTSIGPGSTDFLRYKIDHGIAVCNRGWMRPTWDSNYPIPGVPQLASQLYDLKITLDKTTQTVTFAINEVANYDDPLTDFSSPLWSSNHSRPIGDEYYIQTNPYNQNAKIHDIWSSGGVHTSGTLLESYSTTLDYSDIIISWSLLKHVEDAEFLLYKNDDGGTFEAIIDPVIKSEGLSYIFRDVDCEPGSIYRYRVYVRDIEGMRLLFETEPLAVPAIPLTLYQNFPNPFHPSTTISYYLPERKRVTLDIYDVRGRRVVRLMDKQQRMGNHDIKWNGCDLNDNKVGAGIYFYRLKAGKKAISKKMVLIR